MELSFPIICFQHTSATYMLVPLVSYPDMRVKLFFVSLYLVLETY